MAIKKILIPYFVITGLNSYPDNYKYFRSIEPVTFLGGQYYLCSYTGPNAAKLESGQYKYSDYEKLNFDYLHVTITLDKEVAAVGEQVGYVITTDPALDFPDMIFPVSITDRNGNQAGNLGVTFVKGVAQGKVVFKNSGDYTVTERSLNYRKTHITATIVINGDSPIVRVYDPSQVGII